MSAFWSQEALLFFLAALALSIPLYLKKRPGGRLVPIANMCSLLVLVASLVYIIHILSNGLEDPALYTIMVAAFLLMNFYAGLFNVAARVWARVAELMGNKRLKVSVRAEIVER